MFRYYQLEIAKHQMKVQETAMLIATNKVKEILKPESGAEAWKIYDELKFELSMIRESKKDLENTASKRRRLWDIIVLKIYFWAIKDRFS